MGAKIAETRPSGILVSGSNVTISNSTILNNKYGIILGGENNKIIDTKIKMERSKKIDTDISGIIIAGGNNLIEDSEIEGYYSRNDKQASDISGSIYEKSKRLFSAKIINTALLDPLPFYFGNPANDDSFFEIYGFKSPAAKIMNLPENFILKKIGSDSIEERGEYNIPDFDAMIKMIPKTKTENQLGATDDATKSILMKILKNKAFAWGENEITNKEFINEIEILFESRFIEIEGAEQGAFQEYHFTIPQWVKKLVDFWSEESISDQEFISAIEYVLELEISKKDIPY